MKCEALLKIVKFYSICEITLSCKLKEMKY